MWIWGLHQDWRGSVIILHSPEAEGKPAGYAGYTTALQGGGRQGGDPHTQYHGQA